MNDDHRSSWVFGYGSLADLEALARWLGRPPFGAAEAVHCHLRGWYRSWNVARDNARDIPGYGHYRHAETGERPDVLVTFLNVVRDAGAEVNGVAFRVDGAQLAAVRRRERNYELTDVTTELDVDLGGPVLTSVARPSAIRRFEEGARAGRAWVNRRYRDLVETAFRRRGDDWWRRYASSTEPIRLPVVDLDRVD